MSSSSAGGGGAGEFFSTRLLDPSDVRRRLLSIHHPYHCHWTRRPNLAGVASIHVQHWLKKTTRVVPLLRDYDAFRDEVLFALEASRHSSKLYWSVGEPTKAKLAGRRLPDTFDEMRRAHSDDPGPVCVYVYEVTEEKPSPTSSREEADLGTLGDLIPSVRKMDLKGAWRSGKSTSSAGASSPASSDCSSAFKDCVSAVDKKCVLCGETAAAEAAHIIPVRALNKKFKLDGCLSDAHLDRCSINNVQNGMRLCATHHTAFDAYQWTVNATDMKVIVFADAPESIRTFLGKKLDFSSRPRWLVPPKGIWAAYYKHLFVPSARSSKVGAHGGAVAPTALAASGGAGSVAPAVSHKARLDATRGSGGGETAADGFAVGSKGRKRGGKGRKGAGK